MQHAIHKRPVNGILLMSVLYGLLMSLWISVSLMEVASVPYICKFKDLQIRRLFLYRIWFSCGFNSNTMVSSSGTGTAYSYGIHSWCLVFCVSKSLIFCVVFCRPLHFSFGHCIVCPSSICGKWITPVGVFSWINS